MNVSDEIKTTVHLYVILDLTIKSVQHDQKLFESFKIYRPYVNRCECKLKLLNEELKQVKKALYKQYVSFVSSRCNRHNECDYDFRYKKELITFRYKGEVLKEQVDRKINLVLQAIGEEMEHEFEQENNDYYGVGTPFI